MTTSEHHQQGMFLFFLLISYSFCDCILVISLASCFPGSWVIVSRTKTRQRTRIVHATSLMLLLDNGWRWIFSNGWHFPTSMQLDSRPHMLIPDSVAFHFWIETLCQAGDWGKASHFMNVRRKETAETSRTYVVSRTGGPHCRFLQKLAIINYHLFLSSSVHH